MIELLNYPTRLTFQIEVFQRLSTPNCFPDLGFFIPFNKRTIYLKRNVAGDRESILRRKKQREQTWKAIDAVDSSNGSLLDLLTSSHTSLHCTQTSPQKLPSKPVSVRAAIFKLPSIPMPDKAMFDRARDRTRDRTRDRVPSSLQNRLQRKTWKSISRSGISR